MKPALRRCVAGSIFLAVPAAAGAAGITYDCDTAANHFSVLSLPTGPAPFTVSGIVQLNAIAASKTYAAGARIQISSPAAPGDNADAYAGFSLTALAADAKKTPSGLPGVQMLSYIVNGHEDEVVPLSTMTKPGTPQPFTLAYDGNQVVVSLGAETKTLPLKASDPVVRITCSTGEFLFTDLAIRPSR